MVDDTDLLPAVRLFVHVTQQTLEHDCSGVARVEGMPPISAQWVKQHLGGYRVTVSRSTPGRSRNATATRCT